MTVADSKNSTVSNGKAAGDEVKQVIKGNSDLTGSCKPPKKKNKTVGFMLGDMEPLEGFEQRSECMPDVNNIRRTCADRGRVDHRAQG